MSASRMNKASTTPITQLFLKGRLDDALLPEERSALEGCIEDIIDVEGRRSFIQRADTRDVSYYLIDGYMARYLDDRNGLRQSVGIQIPGDWVDLHSFALKRLDHDVMPLVKSKVAVLPHGALKELIRNHPALARTFWFATLLDAAMLREWTFRLGRLNASGRIAHLICEILERHRLIGRGDGISFPAPLNQSDFAEACGLSAIHANRSFRALRDQGFITDTEAVLGMRVVDQEGLCELSEFRPDYLYGTGLMQLSRSEWE